MSESSNTKRIAKNTLMLYFRQILIMLVSLYTVRVVLEVLGAEDFGIYNVVAGVVTMFSFLSGAMATASQRYFSFDLGKKDYEQLKKTFSVSFVIYVLIALIVVVLAETLGLWFVYNKLVIPADRIQAARWIYHAAIISFVFTILTTPYMALIIAHEDMNIYAYVSIVEAVLKLALVFILPLLNADKLIMYGILMAVVVIINTTLYRTICKKKYPECKAKLQWDKGLFTELISYTGWNMFGASAGVLKVQAVNIVLNQFFNPVVIAARSIASQVNGAVSSFAQNFSTAVRPQIIKSYATSNYDEMETFINKSCKATFFLMFLFTMPLCVEMPFIIKIWLKNPPEFAVVFTRLALIEVLIDSISYSLMTAVQATGKIALYQSIVGGLLLLNFPISFIFCYLGFPPVSVYIIAICISLIATISRFIILKILVNFNFYNFMKEVLVPICVSVFFAILPTIVLKQSLQQTPIVSIVVILFSVCITFCSFFIISLDKFAKNALIGKISSKIRFNK